MTISCSIYHETMEFPDIQCLTLEKLLLLITPGLPNILLIHIHSDDKVKNRLIIFQEAKANFWFKSKHKLSGCSQNWRLCLPYYSAQKFETLQKEIKGHVRLIGAPMNRIFQWSNKKGETLSTQFEIHRRSIFLPEWKFPALWDKKLSCNRTSKLLALKGLLCRKHNSPLHTQLRTENLTTWSKNFPTFLILATRAFKQINQK